MRYFDIDIIRKYDKPGPRYTSYPPAPHFTERFTREDYIQEIRRTNAGSHLPHLSLYFHIPFCDTLCYFCGCNALITKDHRRIRQYTDYMKWEVMLIRRLIRQERQVDQLHWGGGTPTHLTPDEIAGLSTFINDAFHFTGDAEKGCEIDPRGLTREHLEALKRGGFNRISMGVQDFNEKIMQPLNRFQPEELTRIVCGWVRELKFQSLNLDLMYGLPHQSAEEFSETLDTIISINPDRIAVFNFAYVPWLKKHQKLINPETLPSPEEKLEILKITVEKLTGAGYAFIGMDHFAKPGDELAIALRQKKLYRNFQGYSTRAGADLYAFGITGISQLPLMYAQNYRTEREYYTALDNGLLPVSRGYALTRDDNIRRRVILNIMCHFMVSFLEIEKEFSIDFKNYFKNGLKQLQQFAEDGLVIIDDESITVTEMGRYLIRNIAMNFDGFIERKQDAGKYSRTV